MLTYKLVKQEDLQEFEAILKEMKNFSFLI